ncbi:ClpP/crotonase-like domain-containing protein [Mucor mucedo]|uniref:ClpP/crotonase-like domain-containing protein n=1 Tax=Mucor mucedo TaxID=29922 RepID=UPI00221E8E15|nr:ClpP/crotonase-like domain-containing protein [Mucor mucedo]KAI7884138.1 ClpP/crotonase-like domain-containing protein [Mucor mucedo]
MDTIIKQFENKGQGTVRLDLKYQPSIALVTLENPTRHNALSGKMMVELHSIITLLENSQDLVAVIFRGGGGSSFCAGLDLKFARQYVNTIEDSLALNKLMYNNIQRITQLPLLTMGIVTGGAIGGGSEFITGLDFICMSKESGFIHFVQTRMGVSSPWGGMQRLISLVGKKKALLWMAGAYKLDAAHGVDHGVVDIVVDKDKDCLDQTVIFLNQFVVDRVTGQKVSPLAVRGMKKLAIRADGDWDYQSKVFATTGGFANL